MTRIAAEIKYFSTQTSQVRILLCTNFFYGLCIPVIELFISAYIIRQSSEIKSLIIYQIAQATAIPVTFYLNSILSRFVSIRQLYSAGLIFCAVSFAVLFSLGKVNSSNLAISGVIMGVSVGLIWANRNYLTLTITNNNNRNYYFGLEGFLATVAAIIVPSLVGVFIATSQKFSWFPISVSYSIISMGMFLLIFSACIVLHQGNFAKPIRQQIMFFRSSGIWGKMSGLAFLKGLTQGFVITAPAMLVFDSLGKEGTLGASQSVSAIITSFLIYIIGRNTLPFHRIHIFSGAIALLLLSSGILSFYYSTFSIFFMIFCLVFTRPLIDLAYSPIFLEVVEKLSLQDDSRMYSYIFNHEIWLFCGKILGGAFFLAILYNFGEQITLRHMFLLISLIYSLSFFLIKSLNSDGISCEEKVELRESDPNVSIS